MSVLTDVAGRFQSQTTFVQLTGGPLPIQLCAASPARVYLSFSVTHPNSQVINTDGSKINPEGIPLFSLIRVELEIHKHGPLVQSAWFETDGAAPSIVTVVEVTDNEG